MNKTITFKSKPLTLIGRKTEQGNPAREFQATDPALKQVKLNDYDGFVKIITSFLSLDTRVCDLQVKEFNKRAAQASDDVVVIGISQDLPFAQKRFCDANKIDKVITLSDYRTNSFGINYGLLIKELRLLARAVLIIDKDNIIRYTQLVEEATDPPDYEAALRALEEIAVSPVAHTQQDDVPPCVPCETGAPPLAEDRVAELMKGIKGWTLIENKKIQKVFSFRDSVEANYFVDVIGALAEERKHHPVVTLSYRHATIALTTHASNGLTNNDFDMATVIDEITEDD